MAVAHPGIKLHSVRAEISIQVSDDLGPLFAGDMARGEILHDCAVFLFLQCDQITTKGDIFRSQSHPHACGLQGRATGMIESRIVAKNAHVSHIASWRKTFWDSIGEAQYAKIGR